MSSCSHVSRWFLGKWCMFCKKSSCRSCGGGCVECGRPCCKQCSKSEQIVCPCCFQGVTTPQFIMMNNKDWGRCTQCSKICLPISREKVWEDAYDVDDYSACVLDTLCCLALASCNKNYTYAPSSNMDYHGGTTKYTYYNVSYHCSTCKANFVQEQKYVR